MGQALTTPSLQEFLDWESQQTERHEFHQGEVFAMVGARRVHGLISLNIAASLKTQLKGSPCRAFADSMQVRVGADTILYPAVFSSLAMPLTCAQTRCSPRRRSSSKYFPRRLNRMTEAPSSRSIAASPACAREVGVRSCIHTSVAPFFTIRLTVA